VRQAKELGLRAEEDGRGGLANADVHHSHTLPASQTSVTHLTHLTVAKVLWWFFLPVCSAEVLNPKCLSLGVSGYVIHSETQCRAVRAVGCTATSHLRHNFVLLVAEH